MIVLDTNIISELMRPAPEPGVIAWLDGQPSESVWITAVTAFEIRFGLAILPEGKRREVLGQAFEQMEAEDFGGRVLDFDTAAADAAARIGAALRLRGQTIESRDLFIAAITAARRGTLATRNTRHFQDTGVALVDPWESGRD